ncbi:MAG: DUF1847 domain-containing protein, partial [Anaerolineae bacterium]
ATTMSECSKCGVFACGKGETERVPANCPTALSSLVDTREAFADPEIRRIAVAAAGTESRGYLRWTRVEETMEFARALGATRIGLAFCVGLKNEGRVFSQILEANGFEVVSAACKTGAIPKEEVGIPDELKIRPGQLEVACNPIGQALLLNAAETQLNVVMGLCVGHDSLFIKFSNALVTVLVAKDRVLANNPVGALNCAQGYYHHALFEAHQPAGKTG